jgi:large subunit ribosomal protein L34e
MLSHRATLIFFPAILTTDGLSRRGEPRAASTVSSAIARTRACSAPSSHRTAARDASTPLARSVPRADPTGLL